MDRKILTSSDILQKTDREVNKCLIIQPVSSRSMALLFKFVLLACTLDVS